MQSEFLYYNASQLDMNNRKKIVPFASRRQVVLTIFLACLNIALFGLLSEFTSTDNSVLAVGIVLRYLLEIAALGVMRQK
jgi:putative exporter of polyketide antibiotics